MAGEGNGKSVKFWGEGMIGKGRLGRLAAGFAAVVLGLAAMGGVAQAALEAPPIRSTVDANGVDLTTGDLILSTQEVTIGNPGSGGLTFGRNRVTGDLASWRNNLTGTITTADGVTYVVSLGGSSETFTLSSGTYTSDQAAGSTLTYSSGTNKYTYTTSSGVVAIFDKAYGSATYAYALQEATEGWVTQVTYPNGQVDTYTYTTGTVSGSSGVRLQSVTNNLGYHLKLEYSTNTLTSTSDFTNWLKLSKVTGINGAADYCSPTATTCSGLSVTYPSATYDVPGDNALAQIVTDAMGRVTRYTYNSSGYLTGIRRPSAGSDTTTITYDGNNRVATVSNGTGTWSYSYAVLGGDIVTTVTDPLSHTRVVGSTDGLVSYDTNGAGKTVSYTFDAYGRLTEVVYPEGNWTLYAYDSRGNLTSVTQKAKSGSGLSDIVTSASYDSTCTYAAKCNKPNSTTDALGKVTDYTYDTTTGAVLTVTQPAPTTGAVRPQVRYSYTSLYAYYKNSGGSIVAASSPVSMLTGVSTCATGSTTSPTCVGTSDETKTTVTYGSTGVANNLLTTAIAKGAGNGSLTATTAYTYDTVGNLLTIDGPLSGTTDTVRYRYDNDRKLVGIVGPDPDGAGSLKNRATRLTYNDDGRVVQVEQGTVNSQSDTDWAAFSVIEKQAITYDSRSLKTKIALLNASGTTLAVSQFSYDAASRLDCTVIRMNTAAFGSPPAACTLGTTGSNGADRITKRTYDAADRIIKITDAYGTSLQRDTSTITYSNNGLQTTLADALGSLTTYEYDGFDRLVKVRYPDKTTRTASSTTDYEQLTYNAESRVITDRRRDGSSFSLSYDNLGRVTLLDAPSGQNDVTTVYDNFGRVTSTYDSGHTLTLTYDALSRTTSIASPLGTVSYEYDLAGQRTKMTWPGSTALYVNYDYDLAGAVTKIRENGATSGSGVLATYTYDNLGRRATLTRGNGVVTTYTFNDLSELTSLAQDVSGTTNDQTYSLTYNAAGEALARSGSSSNTDYTPATPYNVNRSYSSNGLNQLTAAGSLSLTYDARGNLTGDGVNTYSYDSLNRLTGVNSATLTYDPAGRLYQTAGASTTKFLYDGQALIAEYNSSGTILRRYVHGPGLDEPLVWYEGSGLTDKRWLVTDQLGSVIATTDGSAVATAVNNYDEYGLPGSSNSGRFQYTGQTWISEAGLYNYKSRFYAPNLGRFLQPDPIGYAGGFNLYAYVRNNPINFSDPKGLEPECSDCITVGPLRCESNEHIVYTNGAGDCVPNQELPYNDGWLPDPGDIITDALPGDVCLTRPTRYTTFPTLFGKMSIPEPDPNSLPITSNLNGNVAAGVGVNLGVGTVVYNSTDGRRYMFGTMTVGVEAGAEAAGSWNVGTATSLDAIGGASLSITGAAGGVAGSYSGTADGNMSGSVGPAVGAGGSLAYTVTFAITGATDIGCAS